MVLKILKSGIKSTAIFHDLYLYNGNGKYSQIDLVVATKVGIVVFEIKEYICENISLSWCYLYDTF